MLKAYFVLSFQLHRIVEISHEILSVTGYMSYKSVLDFGGPSDSLYCLFYVESFLILFIVKEMITHAFLLLTFRYICSTGS